MPLHCLDSLEPIFRDVQVPGAWSCVSDGGGFCSTVAEFFLAIWLLCSLFNAGSSGGLGVEESGLCPEGKGRGGEVAVCLSCIDWGKAGSFFPSWRH